MWGGAVTAVSVLPLMSRRSPDSERCSFLFLQSAGDLVPVSVPGQNLIWINGATAAPDTQLGHIAFSALRPRKSWKESNSKILPGSALKFARRHSGSSSCDATLFGCVLTFGPRRVTATVTDLPKPFVNYLQPRGLRSLPKPLN